VGFKKIDALVVAKASHFYCDAGTAVGLFEATKAPAESDSNPPRVPLEAA